MDSLERLSHSLEQAVALIHSLRRENRDLAKQAAEALAAAKTDVAATAEELKVELAKAAIESQQLQEVLGAKAALEERLSLAELESSRLVQEIDRAKQAFESEKIVFEDRLRQMDLAAKEHEEYSVSQVKLESTRLVSEIEDARKTFENEKLAFEDRLRSLELKLTAAEQDAVLFGQAELEKVRAKETEVTASLGMREAELGELRGRIAGTEALLAEKEEELETSKVAIAMLQVKIAETLSPEEILRLQESLRTSEAELDELRPLRDLKSALDSEKIELRRQKKALTGIKKEREQVKAKLDELYSTLDNLRLS